MHSAAHSIPAPGSLQEAQAPSTISQRVECRLAYLSNGVTKHRAGAMIGRAFAARISGTWTITASNSAHMIGYRLRFSTADPPSLISRTVWLDPCTTMSITPEIEYSLL